MKTAKYIYHYIIIICALFAATFTACDKDVHENEYLPAGSSDGVFIVGVQSDTAPDCLSLYFFGSDGTTVLRKDYTDLRTPASEYTTVSAGTYTVVAVANIAATDLPSETTVADLAEWLKENSGTYPDLFTASTQESVAAGEVKRLLLTLQDGTSGITLSTLRLSLTVPGKELPAYTPTRATTAESNYDLRLTAEVYRQGTETCVHRRTLLCTAQADGTYLAELSLLAGDYDLRLWADWTSDGTTNDKYYNADDLTAVIVLTDDYVANGQTDEKDAYYALVTTAITGDTQDESITLERPLTRYRLVATDVEAYNNLIAKGEDLPPIEDLTVSISYEGFFPTGFNVASGKPNDALTGISYSAGIIEADGYSLDEARQVGADFVLTNGDDSYVTVTVSMTDRNTGKDVSTLTGIQIPYRRGCLTTVTGTFLTAGRTSGGVQVDTEWGDEIVVPF